MADGVNLLTGHQTTNHISAADEGFVNSAFFGGENSIIISADDAETLVTINTTTGTVTVGACTALFTGRKVAVAGASAAYTKPASGSVYRRVSAGLLYTRDTDTDVEDVSFVAYTSASDVQPASDAEDDDTGAPTTTEITSATTTAYFELVNAVVSATAVSKQENTFATVDPYGDTVAELDEFEAATANFITDLSSRMNAVESAQTAETTARQNADASLGNRATVTENWKNEADESTYKLVRIQFTSGVGMGYNTQYVVCKCGETSYRVAANASKEAITYTVLVSGDGTSVTASATGYGVSAQIIGSIRITE